MRRGDAAAATQIVRKDASRRGRGRDADRHRAAAGHLGAIHAEAERERAAAPARAAAREARVAGLERLIGRLQGDAEAAEAPGNDAPGETEEPSL